jgi:hypothetical protein
MGCGDPLNIDAIALVSLRLLQNVEMMEAIARRLPRAMA